MDGSFLAADGALLATQATLVALPGDGLPRPLARFAGRWWVLVLPGSIVAVIAAISSEPGVADALSWLALIAVPLLAATSLAWAARPPMPRLALLCAPLFALAWLDVGGLAGDAAAALLTALSTVTLGRLLAGAAPLIWLKLGIVAMAIVDAILVFGNQLQVPNATLNAAVAVPSAPQLQVLDLHYANLGYGDVFIAAVLGGVLAAEGRRQWPIALLTFVLAALWDLLFFAYDTLPATVPVAAALIVSEGLRLRQRLAGLGEPAA